jgi:hypothetical protein
MPLKGPRHLHVVLVVGGEEVGAYQQEYDVRLIEVAVDLRLPFFTSADAPRMPRFDGPLSFEGFQMSIQAVSQVFVGGRIEVEQPKRTRGLDRWRRGSWTYGNVVRGQAMSSPEGLARTSRQEHRANDSVELSHVSGPLSKAQVLDDARADFDWLRGTHVGDRLEHQPRYVGEALAEGWHHHRDAFEALPRVSAGPAKLDQRLEWLAATGDDPDIEPVLRASERPRTRSVEGIQEKALDARR